MAGIYFIAAGQSSRNREKSLDRSLRAADIVERLEPSAALRFSQHYSSEDVVYAWGANRLGHLNKLNAGDYVVDVKNKTVVQVFQFGFWVRTQDTYLQEFIGWDSEKARKDQRPYKFVYFLTNPTKTTRVEKSFFQKVFGQERNQNWLVGQRWFSPFDIHRALIQSNSRSIEQLLGIETGSQTLPSISTEIQLSQPPAPESYESPEWLLPVINQIIEVRRDSQHQERDHEDLVCRFLECLSYERGRDIKFRRGRIDISIMHDETPIIVIEVKRDWSFASKSDAAKRQAFDYSLQTSCKHVWITNGDWYELYDRQLGFGYKDCLETEFQLTRLKAEDVSKIKKLRRECVIGADQDTNS